MVVTLQGVKIGKVEFEMDTMLTVQEVAGRLRVKASWVYSHHSALGAYRLGKYLRFSWPRVLEFLGQSPQERLRDREGTAHMIGRERNGNKSID